METRVKIALVGAGGVGTYHLRALRRLETQGRLSIAAVVEPQAAHHDFALKHELVGEDTPWFTAYSQLLECRVPTDVISIATPIPYHFEMAREAMKRGYHVHLEKPPVPLIQDLETLLAMDSAKKVSVGFQFITSPCLQALKGLISNGNLGEIRSMRATGCWPRMDSYFERAPWAGRLALDGRAVFDGPATNALAHLIHNLMYLAGADKDAFACPEEIRGELYRSRQIESYDCAGLRGRFGSGCEFTVGVSHASRAVLPYQLRVEGSEGWALLSADGDRLETSSGLEMYRPESTEQLISRCYERLVQSIGKGGSRMATRLEDTLPYVRSTNAMFISSGGIHDIAPEFIQTYLANDSMGYHVQGIEAAMERVMETGLLFSELGLPWASALPETIHTDSFHELDLTGALSKLAMH